MACLMARNPFFGFQYIEAADPGPEQSACGGKPDDSGPDNRDIEFLRHDSPVVLDLCQTTVLFGMPTRQPAAWTLLPKAAMP